MRIRVLFQVTLIGIKDKYLIGALLVILHEMGCVLKGGAPSHYKFQRIIWVRQTCVYSCPVCHQWATCQDFLSLVSSPINMWSLWRLYVIEYIRHLVPGTLKCAINDCINSIISVSWRRRVLDRKLGQLTSCRVTTSSGLPGTKGFHRMWDFLCYQESPKPTGIHCLLYCHGPFQL